MEEASELAPPEREARSIALLACGKDRTAAVPIMTLAAIVAYFGILKELLCGLCFDACAEPSFDVEMEAAAAKGVRHMRLAWEHI